MSGRNSRNNSRNPSRRPNSSRPSTPVAPLSTSGTENDMDTDDLPLASLKRTRETPDALSNKRPAFPGSSVLGILPSIANSAWNKITELNKWASDQRQSGKLTAQVLNQLDVIVKGLSENINELALGAAAEVGASITISKPSSPQVNQGVTQKNYGFLPKQLSLSQQLKII